MLGWRRVDHDFDGIPTRVEDAAGHSVVSPSPDACSEKAEDFDGLEDYDGCPEPRKAKPICGEPTTRYCLTAPTPQSSVTS